MNVNDSKQETKVDLAVKVYRSNMNAEVGMKKREFRSMVIAKMRNELQLPDAPYGTMGYYYAIARQIVTGNRRRYVASSHTKSQHQSAQKSQTEEDHLNDVLRTWEG